VVLLHTDHCCFLRTCAIRIRSGQRNAFNTGWKPYYFIGTNFGTAAISFNRPNRQSGAACRELDRLVEAGVSNLRILGASEASSASDAVKPAIQTAPGVYNDSLLIGLDYLLSEMNKRNMHAVIFLNNFWTWSGGMQQYESWFSSGGSVFYLNVQRMRI